MILNKKRINRYLSVLYILSACSWLLATRYNNLLLRGPNFISNYESLEMPYALVYRLFDTFSVILLLLGVYINERTIVRLYGKKVLLAILILTVANILDSVIPTNCALANHICTDNSTLTQNFHVFETLLSVAVFLFAATMSSFKKKWLTTIPVAQVVLLISLVFIDRFFSSWRLPLQILYVLIQVYWLNQIVFMNAVSTSKFSISVVKKIRQLMATVAAFNGILALMSAYKFVHLGERVKNLYFLKHTAWFSQHTIITGLSLLFLSRYLVKGSAVARRLLMTISLFEVVKLSALGVHGFSLYTFAAMLVMSIYTEPIFSHHTSTSRFLDRLKIAAATTLIGILAITFFSVGFSVFNIDAWKNGTLDATRIIKRTLLLETKPQRSDSLKLRLFEQGLSAAGLFMYAWLFLGLFLPILLIDSRESTDDEREFAELLQQYSVSSEDSIKIWPADKRYWFYDEQTAVAFKQSKKVAIALADPIGPENKHLKAIKGFVEFSRKHGMQSCFLMASETSINKYKKAGLKTMPIGSSAIIDTKKFAEITAKEKWWRWVRNKSTKQGYRYIYKSATTSNLDLERLKTISDAWLESNKRAERTFALGYFDKAFLRDCNIHCLVNSEYQIIAFANELPSYGKSSQKTIDLMRFVPEAESSMAFLLSEVISYYHSNNIASFDLGFVPLAYSKSTPLLKLGKKLLKPVFSSAGLEQFKNKFDPTWQQNYIAWDGDNLDLTSIVSALQKALNE